MRNHDHNLGRTLAADTATDSTATRAQTMARLTGLVPCASAAEPPARTWTLLTRSADQPHSSIANPRRRRQLAVWFLAFTLRALPVTLAGGLGAVMENDDGVHFGAALKLWKGAVPYRDFAFVQPPGVLYVLWPFAGLAQVTSERVGMLAARLAFATLGATTALLIYRLVARKSSSAGLAAGAFYAVSATAIAAERTVMLEPLLAFALVASLYVVSDEGRVRPALSGSLIAFGALAKLWMLPVAPVVLVFVWKRFGTAAARRWLLAATGTALGLLLPVLVLAPTEFVHQTFGYQLGRARVWGGLSSRLVYFDWLGTPSQLGGPHWTKVMAAAALILLLLSIAAARRADIWVWGVATGVSAATVLAAPVFFYHYASFAAAPECAAVGLLLAGLTQVRSTLGRRVAALVLVASAVVAGEGVQQARSGTDFPAQTIMGRLGKEGCVWTRTASVAIALDRAGSSCAGTLDDYSRILATGGGTGHLDEFLESADYQQQTQRDFSKAAVAVIMPGDMDRWTDETRAAFLQRFTGVERVGQAALYRR